MNRDTSAPIVCAEFQKQENCQIGIHNITIEHWFPQNPTDGQDLGQGFYYRKMFVICSGNCGYGTEKDLTYDAKRKNSALKVNPRNPDTLATIHYRATVKS